MRAKRRNVSIQMLANFNSRFALADCYYLSYLCTDDVSAVDEPMQQIPVQVRGSPSKGYDVEYTTRTPGAYRLSSRQREILRSP